MLQNRKWFKALPLVAYSLLAFGAWSAVKGDAALAYLLLVLYTLLSLGNEASKPYSWPSDASAAAPLQPAPRRRRGEQ